MSIYIGLLLTVMILIVNGEISSSTIEQDAAFITKFQRKNLHTPRVTENVYDAQCRLINDCCPDEQKNLYHIFTENLIDKQCLVSGREQSSSCVSSIREFNTLKKNPTYIRYVDEVLTRVPDLKARNDRIRRWKKQMKMVCSKDELHAYYCERENMDKFKSCQRKVLQLVAQENVNDDTLYTDYVSQWKKDYIIDDQNIDRAFRRIY